MNDEEESMKRDWNKRAEENARFYIASATDDSEEAFFASGLRDVTLFFGGIEGLLATDTEVIDIGCGMGRMGAHVAPRVKRLTGVDVSGVMIQKARELLAALPNVEFREGDGTSIPANEESADLVFSHIVFQHMPRVAASAYFRDAMRVLRPGGTFVFQVPEQGDGTPEDPPDDDTFEMRFYDAVQLRAELESLGWVFVDEKRHLVESPGATFNQLRVRVTKPV